MTNQEYRNILEKLDLSARAFAPIIGVSTRASQRYAVDDNIPGPVARLMRLIARNVVSPATVKDLD